MWDVNGAARLAEGTGGQLQHLPPAPGYPEKQRSQRGTCWNFFLAVPVSRSCGSIWGWQRGEIGTDLYARLVSSSDSLLFRLGFLHLESFVTKYNGYRPRSRFQLLVTT